MKDGSGTYIVVLSQSTLVSVAVGDISRRKNHSIRMKSHRKQWIMMTFLLVMSGFERKGFRNVPSGRRVETVVVRYDGYSHSFSLSIVRFPPSSFFPLCCSSIESYQQSSHMTGSALVSGLVLLLIWWSESQRATIRICFTRITKLLRFEVRRLYSLASVKDLQNHSLSIKLVNYQHGEVRWTRDEMWNRPGCAIVSGCLSLANMRTEDKMAKVQICFTMDTMRILFVDRLLHLHLQHKTFK